jgi:hypothetical protein
LGAEPQPRDIDGLGGETKERSREWPGRRSASGVPTVAVAADRDSLAPATHARKGGDNECEWNASREV